MDNTQPANDRPVVGLKLPKHYTVQEICTINGMRYRAVGAGWYGVVRHGAMAAANDAWDHYYVTNGAKPRLRTSKYGVTDILTGHSVTDSDIQRAGSYAAAFRLRAERMRAQGDASKDTHLEGKLNRIADRFEEIAQRLEVRRVHDQVDQQ